MGEKKDALRERPTPVSDTLSLECLQFTGWWKGQQAHKSRLQMRYQDGEHPSGRSISR